MASTIGIKIANGEFYSLVEENSQVKKRLVLTTVHNKQRSVQIDLYRSSAKTMADAQYIGSLVVENIKPQAKGEASIEMIISSTSDGEITAEAADLDSSSGAQRQSLNVSLKTLDEESRDFEIPDFDLDAHEPPPQGLYEKAAGIKKDSRKFPWALVIILIAALLLGGAAVWYFVFGGELPVNLPFFSKETATVGAPVSPAPAPEPAPAPTVPVAPVAEEPKPAEAVQVIRAPAAPAPVPAPAPVSRARRSPPVASYKVPSTIPKNGVAYKIRWGDTLWDISEAFYRNAWLYPRIARFNNIRNPDLIISGRTIRIPPRN